MGGQTDKLYTLETDTSSTDAGKATLVAADAPLYFGVSEGLGVGIANGYADSAGFAISSTTGAITYTGSSPSAGRLGLYARARDSRSSTHQADTAWDTTVPVTVDVVNTGPAPATETFEFALATGTSGSVSEPAAAGTVTATDAEGDTVAYSLAASETHMYLASLSDTSGAKLYTLNPSDGQATEVARFDGVGADGFTPLSATAVAGLAWHGGVLYALAGGHLFRVDPAAATGVSLGDKAAVLGSGVTAPMIGIASHGGNLYITTGHSIGVGNLWRVDLAAGTAAKVGSDSFGVGEKSPYGLASHSGTLYLVGTHTDKLYSVNTSTGALTAVGTQTQFGISETAPYALASHGGSLYLAGGTNDKLYTLATSGSDAGKATLVTGSTAGFGVSETRGVTLAGGYTKPADFAVAAATGSVGYTGTSAAAGLYGLRVGLSDGKARDGTASSAVDSYVPVAVLVADAPSAPTGLVATAGNGSVILSGASVTAGTAVTKWQYAVKTGTGQGASYGSWVDVTGTAVSMPSVTISSGISNGSTYAFKVRAVGQSVAGAESAEVSVTLASVAPATPVLTATRGVEKVTLATAALGAGAPIQKWQYQSKTDGAYGEWTDISSTSSTLSADVTGLTAGTAYTFKVRAVNNVGNSSASNEASATPLEVQAAPVFAKASYRFGLVPGSNGSSNAVAVGTVSATDANSGDTVTYGLRATESLMYMVSNYEADGMGAKVYTLNPSNGQATAVGRFQLVADDNTTSTRNGLYNMAWHEGRLLMVGAGGLVVLDPLTARGRLLGTKAQILGRTVQSPLSGIASHNGELYVTTAASAGNLWRVDLDAGTSTKVGSDNLGVSETKPYAIASHGGTLYLTGFRHRRPVVGEHLHGRADPGGHPDAVRHQRGRARHARVLRRQPVSVRQQHRQAVHAGHHHRGGHAGDGLHGGVRRVRDRRRERRGRLHPARRLRDQQHERGDHLHRLVGAGGHGGAVRAGPRQQVVRPHG